jgi:hypothetical protein
MAGSGWVRAREAHLMGELKLMAHVEERRREKLWLPKESRSPSDSPAVLRPKVQIDQEVNELKEHLWKEQPRMSSSPLPREVRNKISVRSPALAATHPRAPCAPRAAAHLRSASHSATAPRAQPRVLTGPQAARMRAKPKEPPDGSL